MLPRAKEFLASLDGQNRHMILYRLEAVSGRATRERRIRGVCRDAGEGRAVPVSRQEAGSLMVPDAGFRLLIDGNEPVRTKSFVNGRGEYSPAKVFLRLRMEKVEMIDELPRRLCGSERAGD